MGQTDAQPNPQRRPQHGDDAAFDQHQAGDFALRHTQTAQRPQQWSALYHRKGHGVVDQKHPHHQRQQTQGIEIYLKRGRHLSGALGALAGGGQPHARREHGGELGTYRYPVGIGRDNQVDTVELTKFPQPMLGHPDIGNQQIVEGPLGGSIAGFE